LIKITMNMDG